MKKMKEYKEENQFVSIDDNMSFSRSSDNSLKNKSSAFASRLIKILLVLILIIILFVNNYRNQVLSSEVNSQVALMKERQKVALSLSLHIKQKSSFKKSNHDEIVSNIKQTPPLIISPPVTNSEVEKGFEKIIWVYLTESLSESSKMVNYIYENTKFFANASNFRVNIIGEQNYQDYLSRDTINRMQNFFKELDERLSKIQKISDLKNHYDFIKKQLICLHILKEHGGVFFDKTVILTEDLLWLNKINEIPYVNKGPADAEPQVVVFYNERNGPNKVDADLNLKPIFRNYLLESPSIEPYFIAAKMGSEFISDWIEEYEASLFEPNIQNYHNSYGHLNSGDYTYDLNSYYSPYYRSANLVLQKKQTDFNLISKIKKTAKIFAIDYYGYYAINKKYFPFKLHQTEIGYIPKMYQLLMKYSIVELQEMVGRLRFCLFFSEYEVNQLQEWYQKDDNPSTFHIDSFLQKLIFRHGQHPASNNYSINPVALTKQWDSLPKKLWVYNADGLKKSTKFLKLNFKNLKKLSLESDFELIELTDINVCEYLTTKSCHLLNEASEKTQIKKSVAFKSELIRLFILKEYGGVWVDSSCLLLENLDWLINITSNPYVTNKFGLLPEVFMFDFHNKMYSKHDLFENRKYGITRAIISPGFDIHLIAAVKNADLINAWLKKYIQFLLKGKFAAFNAFKQISLQRAQNQLQLIEEQLCIQTLQYVVHKEHVQLKKSGNQIKKKPASQKIGWGVQKFGVWTINSNLGPSKFINRYLDDRNAVMQIRYPRSYQEEILGKFKYMTRIQEKDQEELNQLFVLRKETIEKQVDKDSIVSKYLLSYDDIVYF